MAFKLISPSVVDIVPLALAKSHLRVDHAADDTLIASYAKAAIAHIEGYSGMADVILGVSTWEQYQDAFPPGSLKILQRPLISIDKVEYLDAVSGLYVEWPDTNYMKDIFSFYGLIAPVDSWPSPKDAVNAVKVTFKAGFGNTTASIPEDLKLAILLLVGHWYENRETVIIGVSASEVPFSVQCLIGKYRAVLV